MFDAVRNNPKIVQIFLGLITLPFAFWGIDSFRSSGPGSDMASVGDSKITVMQFDQAVRERQERLRQSLGANFRPEMMHSPEIRRAILDQLIDQRLLLLEAEKKRLRVGNEALREIIAQAPSFQENGQFSSQRYETFVRLRGLSEAQFEAQLRQDLLLRQLIGTVGESAFVSTTQADALLRLQTEERTYSAHTISAGEFAGKIQIEPDAVRKYYDDNKPRFETPEEIKADYVVFSPDTLLPEITVSEAEVKAWYESHKERYRQGEERRASHILIAVDDGQDEDKAGDKVKDKAKAKADEVLQAVRQSPGQFAELAKRYSQDPGSAKQGGDLGFFGRGTMLKPFEDAVFSLKNGEISGVIESDAGFHVIKLTGVKPAKTESLEEARPAIEAELKRQEAGRKFAEAAETFNNMVYEQADSLQPVADKFKLPIRHSGMIPRNPSLHDRASLGELADEKVLTALFADDAIKEKRNTAAVEIASATLLAARVVEHIPAALRPFDSVKAEIEKNLRDKEATAKAAAVAEEKLAELRKGEAMATAKLAWSAPKTLSRLQGAAQLPPEALNAIFRADAQKLPAYVSAELGGDFVLYKISQVSPSEKVDEKQSQELQAEYASIVAQEDMAAYLAGLRARYKIEINKATLEAKER